MAMSTKLWGGVASPFGPHLSSFIEDKSDIEVLKAAIMTLVMTRKGERPMLPEFGTAVPDAIFEPNDDILLNDIRGTIQEAIDRWDDRILLEDVTLAHENNNLIIRITYRNAKDPLAEQLSEMDLALTPAMLGL